jgi:DNA-binding MarR family transcriptional regulator
MNEELLKTIGESLIRLRFLVGNQFIKPIKELEREKSELSPGHMHILGWIKSKGNLPVSMTDLAVKTCISKPNLSAMVDRLCAEGMVERLADFSDRRIVNVVLTTEGIEFLNRHKEVIMQFAIDRLAILDKSELEKLKAAIDDIADVIDVLGEKLSKK